MPTASVTRESGNNPPASFPTRELQFPNERTAVSPRENWSTLTRVLEQRPEDHTLAKQCPKAGHSDFRALGLFVFTFIGQ